MPSSESVSEPRGEPIPRLVMPSSELVSPGGEPSDGYNDDIRNDGISIGFRFDHSIHELPDSTNIERKKDISIIIMEKHEPPGGLSKRQINSSSKKATSNSGSPLNQGHPQTLYF